MKHKNILIIGLAVVISGTVLALAFRKKKEEKPVNKDADYNELIKQIDNAPK